MSIKGLVSIIVPSRNEVYLAQTVNDLLEKSSGAVEIVVILEGYWPEDVNEDPRVRYIHFSEPRGMRNAINSAVAIARGEYIMKCDAHCMFDEGYDEALKKDVEYNWIIIPRRYPLDPEKWQIEDRTDNKYPVDYMYLSPDLHGEPWLERRDDPKHNYLIIDDTMSAQGSCWFMKRGYYDDLELLDEKNYGTFYNEFQEIGLKCWLSGGEIKVNKSTWYAHWHKPKSAGRGYSLDRDEQQKAIDYLDRWILADLAGKGKDFWHKQIYTFEWLNKKFNPPI